MSFARSDSLHRGGLLAGAVLLFCVCGCAEQKEEAPVQPATTAPSAAPAPKPEPPKAPELKTLKNLQEALSGESNANARYTAFAAKADEEGYKDVANLFRAAARAEKIHADGHAEIIKKLGGAPTPALTPPEVKTTAENLKAAFDGETAEATTMYPGFIAAAKAEGNMDALRTFIGAKAAEESHAAFYKDAMDNLDKWKGDSRTFYVCGVCGYTVTKINFESCPICFVSKDKYEEID